MWPRRSRLSPEILQLESMRKASMMLLLLLLPILLLWRLLLLLILLILLLLETAHTIRAQQRRHWLTCPIL